jgi:hypothetical protein
MFPTKRAMVKDAPVGTWLLWIGAPRLALHKAQMLHVFQVQERNGKRVPGPVLYESAFIGVQAHLDEAHDIAAYLNAVHANEGAARAYIEKRRLENNARMAQLMDDFLRGTKRD